MIVAAPPGGGLFAADALPANNARSLLNWVERGNTLLLVVDRNSTPLHQALNDTVVSGEKRQEEAFAVIE